MKKVIIVYDQALSGVQGINNVNNSFVLGQDIFKLHDLQLTHIVSPVELFEVEKHKSLKEVIGSKCESQSGKKSGLKNFVGKLCSPNLLLFSYLRMYFGYLRKAKQAVANLDKLPYTPDYIIFQDGNTAYNYFKTVKDPVKSILILHCSDDYLEQAKPVYPGYYKYKFLENRVRAKFDYVFSKVCKVVYLSEHAVKASYLPTCLKVCIPNGIKDEPSIQVQGPGEIIQMVSVGTVSRRKGQLLGIQALTLLDKSVLNRIHFHVIGGGESVEECKDYVKEHYLEKYVTIYGNRNDVSELLKKMDLFILPSYSEGMPMSILEAMRHGLFILATETGAIPEMIRPEFGRIITREPENIADTITEVIESGALSLQAKSESRLYYLDHYTTDIMVGTYAKLLTEI